MHAWKKLSDCERGTPSPTFCVCRLIVVFFHCDNKYELSDVILKFFIEMSLSLNIRLTLESTFSICFKLGCAHVNNVHFSSMQTFLWFYHYDDDDDLFYDFIIMMMISFWHLKTIEPSRSFPYFLFLFSSWFFCYIIVILFSDLHISVLLIPTYMYKVVLKNSLLNQVALSCLPAKKNSDV